MNGTLRIKIRSMSNNTNTTSRYWSLLSYMQPHYTIAQCKMHKRIPHLNNLHLKAVHRCVCLVVRFKSSWTRKHAPQSRLFRTSPMYAWARQMDCTGPIRSWIKVLIIPSTLSFKRRYFRSQAWKRPKRHTTGWKFDEKIVQQKRHQTSRYRRTTSPFAGTQIETWHYIEYKMDQLLKLMTWKGNKITAFRLAQKDGTWINGTIHV